MKKNDLSKIINNITNKNIDFDNNKNVNFGSLEIDSLDMFDIISELESTLEIEFNNEEFLNIQNFDDLLEAINIKVAK